MTPNPASACQGKHPFPTLSMAARIAHRVARRAGGKCNAYLCPACGHWHVGSHIGKNKRRST